MLRILLALNCVLACLTAASAEPLTKERLEKSMDECTKETNLDKTAIDTVEKSLEVAKDEKKCFGGCVMGKMGMINDDGTFNVDVAKESIPEGVPHDEAVKFIEICSAEILPKESDDACSTASTWIECLTTDKNDTKVPWN